MSRTELADAAGVSMVTVQRAEGQPEIRVKRSTLTDLLTALHARAPVDQERSREFLRSAGMSEAFIEALDKLASHATSEQVRWSSPDRETVHLWVDVLASTLGDKAVMSILHGYAAGMQVELPPRVGAARPITPQTKLRSGT